MILDGREQKQDFLGKTQVAEEKNLLKVEKNALELQQTALLVYCCG